jgi:hypothetical protein
MLFSVKEFGRLDVRITLLVASVDGTDSDLRSDRGGAIWGHCDRAGEIFERAAHLAHNQVSNGESYRGVNGVDGPYSGVECSYSHGSGHVGPSRHGVGLSNRPDLSVIGL